jgi:hypothetical protein
MDFCRNWRNWRIAAGRVAPRFIPLPPERRVAQYFFSALMRAFPVVDEWYFSAGQNAYAVQMLYGKYYT